jgi:AcrR family transcriptional regulator
MAGMPSEATASNRRGPAAAATREEVLAAATRVYLAGERVDVLAIAAELGIGRATVYRWFGSRERLIGEVLIRVAARLVSDARAHARPRARGSRRLVETFDHLNRALAESAELRRFLEHERSTALRIITSSDGMVQPRMVALIREAIDDEVDAGTYRPPVDTDTLAYAIVRLAEAFLFNDAVADIRGDVDRLREVEAALLGSG